MRKVLYNYCLPFRRLFEHDKSVEKFSKWYSFREQWETREPTVLIIPLSSFDLIGLDIRFSFREYGFTAGNLHFLLVGTVKQINFALSQNDVFLRNNVYEIMLPRDYDTLEYSINKKIELIENKECR